MIIGLPSGIGDVSWAISKLLAVKDLITHIEVADGWPYRTVPYLELAGFKASYGAFNYQTIQMYEVAGGFWPQPGFTKSRDWSELLTYINWDRLDEDERHTVRLLTEPNRHLELGRRLEEWLPDLPCSWHYPLYTSLDDGIRAQTLIEEALSQVGLTSDVRLVGVSCASYRGAEAWKTWGREQWRTCLQKVLKAGWTPILLGGFWDDLTHAVSSELRLPNIVGRTNVAECVALLRLLPAYFGFSSGLNVIRTVLNLPAMALWPDHQWELSTAWVPPDMLTSQRYVSSLWRPPSDVWPILNTFLERCWAEYTRREKSNGASLPARAGQKGTAKLEKSEALSLPELECGKQKGA